jgi:hypothetical protein
MSLLLSQRVVYATLFYVLVIMLVMVLKPTFIFDEYGNIRPFGVGNDKTLFSLGVITVATAILSFYLFCIIDLIFV